MNLYDMFIIIVIFLSTIFGLIRGFLREIISILIFFISFLIFYVFDIFILKKIFLIYNFLFPTVLFIIFFIFIFLFLESLSYHALKNFFYDCGILGLNNYILGFLFGLLRGIFIILFIILFMNKFLHINNKLFLIHSYFFPILIKCLYLF
ncbi:CvpA family protein [Buchnera aphidicola]|uniref:CvpA family protein n=1 Tax=Buchnera aphidicola TaxID=9 RepID=UPI0039C8F191|nr:CvpA family protein [Buchnera aphidicola (Chaitophorus viminalis)]